MTEVGAAPRPVAPSAPERRKALVAGGIGNFIEWYDYGVYGSLSPILAKLFFPDANVVVSTLAAFAVFGVGFLVRPLGGLFFGQLGDRRGRRTALALALTLVSLSTFGMGLLPTYATAGVLAPLLLTVLRVVQGFSAGGEWTGSAALIVENAPEGRRGWMASWQQFTVITGQLAGIVVVSVITNVWGEAALSGGGWRWPFLIALVFGVLGFYIRYRMEDTPHFQELQRLDKVSATPTREALRTEKRAMLRAFWFVTLPNIGFYTFMTYMPTFLEQEGGLSLTHAYTANLVGMIIYAVLTPVIGRLSDRIGRRPSLIAHAVGLMVLAFPIYLLLSGGSYVLALVMQLPVMLLMALYSGAGTAGVTELFPSRLRYSALALPYNLSSAIFGGTAPFVTTWLIATFHTPLAPAFYVIIIAIPTLFVYVRMPETAHRPLRDV